MGRLKSEMIRGRQTEQIQKQLRQANQSVMAIQRVGWRRRRAKLSVNQKNKY